MTWRPVAALDEAEGANPWLPVRVERTSLLLARQGERWYGVADRCTHAGCPLAEEATIEDGTIHCHCHGSEFDLATGEVLEGPAEYPLQTYQVRVTGDSLEVDV
ncbi:MAG TPA: Rieske (2Fe-2S) protein [Candidatus Limnocylindrales bacterium]|nr:Rieske (2Fe-2S) protein [Candidatus Limnocylindrales bacterium]